MFAWDMRTDCHGLQPGYDASMRPRHVRLGYASNAWFWIINTGSLQ